MAEPTITNPLGAWQNVTDFTTFSDGSSTTLGRLLDYPRRVDHFRANAAITQYDWVMFVAATTTVSESVTPMTGTTLTVSLTTIGVALETAAAGDLVPVCTSGIVLCNIGTGAPARGDVAVRNGSAAGACAVVASAAWDATQIAGVGLGVFLTAEIGTLNRAAVYINRI